MAESTHSIYKTEFLKKEIVPNKELHLKSLERFVEYYNHERYPTELYGYTPMEIIAGKIPDKHKFKQQIAEARIKRIKTNQEFNLCGSF